ncbi:hypothetical protein JZ751_022967 [Albula glossodonta]|uniref:Cytoskeleton-associated protein 2 C-terminal domain-containing protein n=1 Tax=Albula glossodonta TaxID=121402 RepID=A0A8T2PIY3_9TELE|nr:hypothetical protein JZ751_022967 [Albula glossodonta]
MSTEVTCSTTEKRDNHLESYPARKKMAPFGVKSKTMDHVSQTNVGSKRPQKNKENTKPVNGQSVSVTYKAVSKKAMVGSSPLRSKNIKISENVNKEGDAPKKTKTQAEQEEKKAQPAGRGNGIRKRQTLTQAFLSQHAIQQKRLLADAAKPPATIQPKPILGTYKGKVIQSKVNSFRKPAGNDGNPEGMGASKKSAVPKQESKRRPAMTATRAKPTPEVPKPAALKPSATLPHRPKSVSHRAPAPTAKPVPTTAALGATSSRARLYSAPSRLATSRVAVPTRVVSGMESKAQPSSSKTTVTLKKKELQQTTKSKTLVVASERKAPKPPATSTLSQYRISVETAEERKAKLAEWLASKGKTLKRPPVTSALLPTVSRTGSKSFLKPKPETVSEPKYMPEMEPVAQQDSDAEPKLAEELKCGAEPDKKPGSDPEVVAEIANLSSSDIMNTTLDLLENSEMDLPVDPEVRMEDVVVNLCCAMEAMQVPSTCQNDPQAQGDNEGNILEKEDLMSVLEEISTSEVHLENEMDGINQVKEDREAEEEISELRGMKAEKECKDAMVGDDEDGAETPIQETEGASVVRYSVKTTPYLQSVKRRIQSEVAPGSGSRRKSGIKDLKFLTPVRRSLRIQRELTRLPGMLTDHDPCVSSLAELVKLDDDANAYIYRKNPALLEELPDQPENLEKF